MEITTIGLDIAKRVLQAHGVDAAGRAALRRKLGRSEVLDFFRALPPCLIGIEACCGSAWKKGSGAVSVLVLALM
jgi:transposase